jgi:hypothetical protein
MALLFEWDVHDGDSRLVARELACLHVAFNRGRRVRRAEVCRWTRELAECAPVQRRLQSLRTDRLLQTATEARATATAVERRLSSIDNTLRTANPQSFQGSLFDRRAEQRARATRTARDLTLTRIAHQRSSIQALRTMSSAQPARLVAAWVIPVE